MIRHIRHGDADRLDLLRANVFTTTITRNTGQTSTLAGNRSSTVVGAVLTVTAVGTVTSGLFAGDTFIHEEASPATDILLCTVGLGTVSNLFAQVTLEITSV